MSDTESKIKALEEKHKAELQALEEARDKEVAAAEEKKRIEQEKIKLHGVKDAIAAIVKLDDKGIFKQKDGELLLVAGDVTCEVLVHEVFARTSGWSRRYRGESRGIWYELGGRFTHSLIGDYKTRKWKNPKKAYESMLELVEQSLSIKSFRSEQAVLRETAIAELNTRYPDHKRCEYNELTLVGKHGAEVLFEPCADSIVGVKDIKYIGDNMPAVAALILEVD